jgi:hypothetical protein
VRKYLTKEELYVLLEEQHGAEVRVWDVDYSSGEFLGFYYDGDLIRIPTPGCQAKSCGPLASSYCFPHTIFIRQISKEEGRAQIKARREQAFGVGCDD